MLGTKKDKQLWNVFLEWVKARGYEPEPRLYKAFCEMIVNASEHYGIKNRAYVGFSKAKNCVCIGESKDKFIPIEDTGLTVTPPTFDSPNHDMMYSAYVKWCADRNYFPSDKLWHAFLDMVFDAMKSLGFEEVDMRYRAKDKALYMSGDKGNTWIKIKDETPVIANPKN